MSGPLQRIGQALGQAIGQLFGRRGPPPQPVYRERIGKAPKEAPQGPINRPLPPEQQQRTLYRVGLNPDTGLGQYPTKHGVAGALRRVPEGRVQVRVYGQPAWDTSERTSPPPDEAGNVYVTFFANKAELEATLAGPGDMQDWISEVGGYDFDKVLTVWVGQA
jgi:hypothetical protein